MGPTRFLNKKLHSTPVSADINLNILVECGHI